VVLRIVYASLGRCRSLITGGRSPHTEVGYTFITELLILLQLLILLLKIIGRVHIVINWQTLGFFLPSTSYLLLI
jgi:hypothetical protein